MSYECTALSLPSGVVATCTLGILTVGSSDCGRTAAMVLRRLADKLDRIADCGCCSVCGEPVSFIGDRLCYECTNVGQEAGSQ